MLLRGFSLGGRVPCCVAWGRLVGWQMKRPATSYVNEEGGIRRGHMRVAEDLSEPACERGRVRT